MGLEQEWPPRVAEEFLAPEEQKGVRNLFANKIVKNYGLAKNDRIYLNNDFKDIIENGVKVYGEGIVLWHRPYPLVRQEAVNPAKPARIGIIVSKKLGNAVCRNRCKRLFREVFRLNRHLLIDGADCIVCPKDSKKLPDYQAACAAFFAIAKKAKILRNCKDL